MRRVFISYGRADAEYAAGALGRELRLTSAMSRSLGTKKMLVAVSPGSGRCCTKSTETPPCSS